MLGNGGISGVTAELLSGSIQVFDALRVFKTKEGVTSDGGVDSDLAECVRAGG